MRFEKTFEVAGTPAEVIDLFDNLPLMASFLPGATVGERGETGSWPATLVVSFGPKRISFNGKLRNDVDRPAFSGCVTGTASTDIRGAKMSATMTYQLSEAPGGTRVSIVSETELTGMLAEFGRTGGVVLADALISQFAASFSDHVAASHAKVAGVAPAVPRKVADALSVFTLLRQIIKSALRLGRLRHGRG